MKNGLYRLRLLLLVTGLYCEALPAQNAGDLDDTFGDGGTSTTDFGTGFDKCAGLVIQPDQKIVVSGMALIGIYAPTLIRMNPDGSLDNTFGEDGIARSEAPYSWQGSVETLLMQPDGKLVCCYTTTVNGYSALGVSRFNTDGTLDADFGDGGNASNSPTDFFDAALSMVLQEDGKIVVVGQGKLFLQDQYRMVATRFMPDGTVDETFGENGDFIFSQGTSADLIHDVVQQDDGKLVLMASSQYGSYWEVVLIRLNDDGSFDGSYGENGFATFNINNGYDTGRAMTLRNDGSVIVTGVVTEGDNLDVLLMCVDANGDLDGTFGNNGMTISPVSEDHDHGDKVMIASDGKIVVSGYQVGFDTRGMVLRYTATGELDETFNEDGVAYIEGTVDFLENIKQQADGKLVVAGQYWDPDINQPDFGASRLLYEDANAVNEFSPEENAFSIYPNPSDGIVTLKWIDDMKERVTISIKDLSGKIVWQSGSAPFAQKRIDLSHLPGGSYSISIDGETMNTSSHMVIVR
jgi:uncharacterized delta-60 repeat protein